MKDQNEKPGADSGKRVYALSRPSRCFGCDRKLEVDEICKLARKQDVNEVYCLACADLSGMVVLPAGDASLTRLCKKYSSRHFVIVKWSDLWKTYERQGLLVEAQALEKARAESLSKS